MDQSNHHSRNNHSQKRTAYSPNSHNRRYQDWTEESRSREERDVNEGNFTNSASEFTHPKGYSSRHKRVDQLRYDYDEPSMSSEMKRNPFKREKQTINQGNVQESPGYRTRKSKLRTQSPSPTPTPSTSSPRRMSPPVRGTLTSPRKPEKAKISDHFVPGKHGFTVRNRQRSRTRKSLRTPPARPSQPNFQKSPRWETDSDSDDEGTAL